ncbi:MAG: phenylalanine--tRNA ligase subunit alpha [Vicinamibacteraceae bacterium]
MGSVSTPRDLQSLRDRYLGRKGGRISSLYADLASATADKKRELGARLNQLKAKVEGALDRYAEKLAIAAPPPPRIDPTLAGRRPVIGHVHPLTYLRTRIEAYFAAAGYEILDGPETEDDYHNFEALNLPAEHPARDMQDTLYLEKPWTRAVFPVGADRPGTPAAVTGARPQAPRDERAATLLRTHTSAMQIRYMERHEPPVRIICPGRVYRRDNLDQTHTPMFQQVEGLVVGEGVTMAQLKGTLVPFLRDLFGERIEITFRPSFFPYTEPSADVFLRDPARGPKWLEVLGCGMVNPAVFEAVGYDPERFTGFAFGMGIERLAMLLFGVDDIRQFYENDVRFLEQFPQ